MIKNLGVVGAGTMGFGIAFQFAINGIQSMLCDVSEETLATAKEKFEVYLDLFREEGYKIRLSNEEIKKNISYTTSMEDLADCDFVIESVSENLVLKQKLFKQLDDFCSPDTILASNTSSLKLSDITRDVGKHKEQIILTHFFNPPHIVPLVELLRTEYTSERVFRDVKEFLEQNGKVTIEVKKEVSGLVANRIQVAMAREALSLIEDGVVSEEDLDTAIFDGPGFRFSSSGLLKIIDFGGLDIWKIVLEELQPKIESQNRRFSVIEDRVAKGSNGVKTGAGFYEYPGKGFNEYVMERDKKLIQHLLNTHPELKTKKEETAK